MEKQVNIQSTASPAVGKVFKVNASATREEALSNSKGNNPNTLYFPVDSDSIIFNGKEYSSGGRVNVVQTTGSSTSDVMSQDIVTKELNKKQPTLKSGENIKTVNGVSLVGSGDTQISGYISQVVELTSGSDTSFQPSSVIITDIGGRLLYNKDVKKIYYQVNGKNYTNWNVSDFYDRKFVCDEDGYPIYNSLYLLDGNLCYYDRHDITPANKGNMVDYGSRETIFNNDWDVPEINGTAVNNILSIAAESMDLSIKIAQTIYLASQNNQYTSYGLILYVKPMKDDQWWGKLDGGGIGTVIFTFSCSDGYHISDVAISNRINSV